MYFKTEISRARLETQAQVWLANSLVSATMCCLQKSTQTLWPKTSTFQLGVFKIKKKGEKRAKGQKRVWKRNGTKSISSQSKNFDSVSVVQLPQLTNEKHPNMCTLKLAREMWTPWKYDGFQGNVKKNTACTDVYCDRINAVKLNVNVLQKTDCKCSGTYSLTQKTVHLHRCRWHLTRQNAQRDRDGDSGGAGYTQLRIHTHKNASLCHANVPHTLELDRLLLWKARGPATRGREEKDERKRERG